MNPQGMMQFMAAINTFRGNHPKFFSFIQNVLKGGMPVDTIIEMTVTKPGEEPITTNIKVKQSDIELFESIRNQGL